jgi:hypothetical protein
MWDRVAMRYYYAYVTREELARFQDMDDSARMVFSPFTSPNSYLRQLFLSARLFCASLWRHPFALTSQIVPPPPSQTFIPSSSSHSLLYPTRSSRKG